MKSDRSANTWCFVVILNGKKAYAEMLLSIIFIYIELEGEKMDKPVSYYYNIDKTPQKVPVKLSTSLDNPSQEQKEKRKEKWKMKKKCLSRWNGKWAELRAYVLHLWSGAIKWLRC